MNTATSTTQEKIERAAPQWQPIETAPKDRPILLRSKKGRIADGMWIAATDTRGGWAWALVRQEPTHWMPIPPEPSAPAAHKKIPNA